MVTEKLKAPYSHYLFNTELSRQIDRRTITEAGIGGLTLMEIAGHSAANLLFEQYPHLKHGLFLCGKGNNAGDALVVARYLAQKGVKTTVIFINDYKELSDDTEKNLELLRHFAGDDLHIVSGWKPSIEFDYDFLVDGILGTGLKNDVKGTYASAIEWTNEQKHPVFSMDIPSGLNADSGNIMGTAIQATHTYSFGGLKQGFYLNNGPNICGDIHYCELPFPNHYKSNCQNYLLDEQWVSIPSPTPLKHKYAKGVLYLIAGSEGLSGAAIMAAKSAWAEGLGAVILVCPKGILPVFEQTLPTIIKKPVGKQDDFFFKAEHTGKVLDLVQEKIGKILIGPGLGRDESTVKFIRQLLKQSTSDIVVDADGLWALAQEPDWKKPTNANWILTPHPGELYQLTQRDINDDHSRLKAVIKYAKEQDVSIMSKGMPGIIASQTGKTYVTNYNTTYFARAGSGDVLAGKTAAYLTLGYAPDESCAMAFLNGKRKLEQHFKSSEHLPEPKDFI